MIHIGDKDFTEWAREKSKSKDKTSQAQTCIEKPKSFELILKERFDEIDKRLDGIQEFVIEESEQGRNSLKRAKKIKHNSKSFTAWARENP